MNTYVVSANERTEVSVLLKQIKLEQRKESIIYIEITV